MVAKKGEVEERENETISIFCEYPKKIFLPFWLFYNFTIKPIKNSKIL